MLFYFCSCISLGVGTVQVQETSVQVYDGITIKVDDIIEAGYNPSIYQYNTIKVMEGNYLRDYKEEIAFSKLEVVGI